MYILFSPELICKNQIFYIKLFVSDYIYIFIAIDWRHISFIKINELVSQA